jgi:hypothetical protein
MRDNIKQYESQPVQSIKRVQDICQELLYYLLTGHAGVQKKDQGLSL